MNRWRNPAALAALLVLAAPCAKAEPVQVTAPDGTVLTAHWMPRPGGGPGPAIVALHGCGGLYTRDGKDFSTRYRDYATRLSQAGFHVLLPDSFGSRGRGSICAVPGKERTITVKTRRGDLIAAVGWLAQRPDVDRQGIVVLGWSHGATTVLSALDASRPDHLPPLAGAVALYPGCSAQLRRGVQLTTPLLMLLGEKDDWTPPSHCIELADRTWRVQPDADIALHIYSDSYHGFDSTQPVRFRRDVKDGVHAGGNPTARAAALAEIDAFLAKHVHGPTATGPVASSSSSTAH
jgi:dienelactone hydrolase